MSQVTLRTMFENRYGADKIGGIMKHINDSYKKGTMVNTFSAGAGKEAANDDNGIAIGFFIPSL